MTDPRGMWYIEDARGGSATVLEVAAGCGGGPGLVATFEMREQAEPVVRWWNAQPKHEFGLGLDRDGRPVTDRIEALEARLSDRGTTHAEGCWTWGPRHYGCAVGRVEELEREFHRFAIKLPCKCPYCGAANDPVFYMGLLTMSDKYAPTHCTCGGKLIYTRDHGRIWSACDTCTPVETAHCTDGPAYIKDREPHYPGPRGHEKITVVPEPETPAPSEVEAAFREGYEDGTGDAFLISDGCPDYGVDVCWNASNAKARLASPSGAAAPQDQDVLRSYQDWLRARGDLSFHGTFEEWKAAAPQKCPARSPGGLRCALEEGHEGDHTALRATGLSHIVSHWKPAAAPQSDRDAFNAGWKHGERVGIGDRSEREEACDWYQDEESVWATACGQMFEFTNDGPTENGFRFCYHCGSPVRALDGEEA